MYKNKQQKNEFSLLTGAILIIPGNVIGIKTYLLKFLNFGITLSNIIIIVGFFFIINYLRKTVNKP